MRRLQVGVLFDIPVHPDANFGTFLANVQAGLGRAINFRMDLGVEQASFGTPLGSTTKAGFLFGVGLPLKARVNRYFAITSGSAAARGFGAFPLLPLDANSTSALYESLPLLPGDFFTFFVLPGDNGASPAYLGSFTLPIGFLVQPHPVVAIGVRTGYRMQFTGGGGSTQATLNHFVPLAFDLVVTPIKQLDLGFTATLWGLVAGDSTTVMAPGYADLRIFELYLGAHI